MIFEGLLSPYVNGNEKPAILYETALARIRQLSAHEVGHTLGLGHNYYDSSKGWISVMDYPHPLEELKEDGTIDLSKAYPAAHRRLGQGGDQLRLPRVPEGHRRRRRRSTKILDDAWAQDLRYFTNQDTDIHPRAEQWSNGVNQGDELTRLMKVRRAALNRLGEHTIRTGAPTVMIEEPLVPIYMYHRYAVEGAASMIGGQDFVYAMRGDGRTPMKWVSGEIAAQGDRRAGGDAEAVGADDPEADPRSDSAAAAGLRHASRAVPAHDRRRLRSGQPGVDRRRRHDRLRAAARSRGAHGGAVRRRSVAARPGRSDRPAHQGDVRRRPTSGTYEAEVRRAVERVLVDRVMWLASVGAERAGARDRVAQAAEARARACAPTSAGRESDQAQHTLLAADIKRFLERPAADASRR